MSTTSDTDKSTILQQTVLQQLFSAQHVRQMGVIQYASLTILLLAVVLASIRPLEWEAYMLHQLGTLLMIAMLLWAQWRIGLTALSFVLYIGFLLIHVLAAHYLYSYVPYDAWLQACCGFSLNELMGWQRNMYDRLVHFASGLLLYPFFYRLFQVAFPSTKPVLVSLLVIQFVMGTALIYEWIEWAIAITLSPQAAELYNGQQGDVWDAHKDMLLATLGAVLAAVWSKRL